MELARLAGALCTFALDSHPRTLPLYDHDNLSDCFDALDRHIRAHLETMVPTNCVAIPLEKMADYFYEGDITDTRTLGRARWFLGVRSNVGEAELITRIPQLVKVCSANHIEHLVRNALPGVPLTYVPAPPSAIPIKLNYQYFSLSQSGVAWEAVQRARNLAAYVPGDLPNPQLELIILLPQAG